MTDDTKFVRDGPVLENHHPLDNQWESNGLKNENEHPAGVAPPCRPPPAGCSEFPIHAFHHRTAPTGFMEGGHVP